MASDFHAVLLEGVFYIKDDRFLCRKDTCELVDVRDVVAPLFDHSIHFAAHHVPPMPPNLSAWGMGSCLGESRGYCGFGHQDNAAAMLNVQCQGTLVDGPSGWYIRRVDGRDVHKDLRLKLSDHHGRLLMASAMTVEQMRDSVVSSGQQVEDLTERASALQSLLSRLADNTEG